MAKINAETIEDIVGVVKKAASEGEAESIAKSLKIDTKDVQKIVDGKASKTLIKRVFETAGSTIRGLQGKLDEALSRPKPSPTAFPGALREIPTQVDGTMATGRGGPLVPVPRPAPEPAGPTALERIGAKAAIGGGEPPRVPSEFTTEQIRSKGETGYQIPGQPGGPIVPAQSRALSRVSESLAANEVVYDPVTKAPMSAETTVVPFGSKFDRPVVSPEEIAEAASKAKPEPAGPAGKGVSERNRTIKVSKGDESAQQAERAAEFGLNIDLGLTPSRETMRKAGKLGLGVTAGGGALAAGYRLFGDKPLSQQPDAPSTLKAGDVKDTQELVDLADKAAPTLPPEQAQKAKENAEKIKTIQDLLADVEKRKQQKVDRIELMQAIETMAHGLVTAIGAGVMLNRGSPFAVDFSKGPKVDWASQLDRLQKDFDTQTNALIKKYGIEEDMKAKQEELALKKRGLDIEEQKVAQQVTKQQAEAVAKLTTEQQKQYNTNLKNYGDLRRAIADKKPGAVQDAATLLGADDATIAKLTESMNQGMWDKILTMLGISEQPTTEQILQGLRPQKPAAPAAAPAAVTVGGKTYTRPKGMSDADWAEYVKEVGGQ